MNTLDGDAPVMADLPAASELKRDIAGLAPDGRIYLDFDHTLFLWNSTESLVNEARPSGILGPLLKIISGLVPWKWIGRDGYFIWRDVFRLLLVFILAPWTIARFRKAAPAIYARERNPILEEAVSRIDPPRIVIVSFGLHWIIRALLKGSALEGARIVAPGIWGLGPARARGKVSLLARAGLVINPDTDIVVTDSAKDDADILAATARGHVIQWPLANTGPGLSNSYFPFFYTARIKRTPGFLVKQVFLEELPVILIMFGSLYGPMILPSFVSVVLLFVSYMLIYEIGYAENDRVGERTEAEPKLSKAYFKHRNFRLEPDAWIWAAGISLAAFAAVLPDMRKGMLERVLLDGFVTPEWSVPALAAIWMLFLAAARTAFFVFNHVPLAWRVFVYLPLHASKYFGPLLFLPIHPGGVALGLAQIVRTWSMYAIRRAGGDEHILSSQMVRLNFLIVFSVVVFAITPLTPTEASLLALSFVFCIVRAIPEVRKKMTGESARLPGAV